MRAHILSGFDGGKPSKFAMSGDGYDRAESGLRVTSLCYPAEVRVSRAVGRHWQLVYFHSKQSEPRHNCGIDTLCQSTLSVCNLSYSLSHGLMCEHDH